MRILISVQNYHPAYSFGGRVTKSIALAEGLSGLGHSVSVVTTTVLDREHRPSFHSRTDEINGVKVYYLGTLFALARTSLNPSAFGFARAHIQEFDAVYVLGLYDSLSPVMAHYARKQEIPYGVEPIGMLVPIVRSIQLKRIYHNLVGRKLIECAQSIIVTSESEWNDALRFGIAKEKLVLRRNGVNLEEYRALPPRGQLRQRLGIPLRAPLILWYGRIERIKNLEQLLDAVAGLGMPFHLVIAGPVESQEYMDALRNQVQRLMLEHVVHFMPAIYGEDKRLALADADLVVLVSLSENWGNAVLEAIAAGVPVLVTDTCGVAQVVDGKGGLMVERTIDGIRNGIEQMLSDTVLYQGFKSQLPDLARHLSWVQPVQEMNNMIRSWRKDIVA